MLPVDYAERVYAGVLGKMIGVYLGRPFEGWSYDQITTRFGEITTYVNDALNHPLVITDDDLTGTFTFLRALADHGYSPDLSPAQIGETWLNYIIQNRTILWWGGVGHSTEHTAYARLRAGVPAPRSGSIALNGRIIAEQIGAQIFIDGWGMVAPGDPERAADLARRAASVSHDGEAVYGAQVVAAMNALAFVQPDLHQLLDAATALIPADSIVYRLIADLRERRAAEPDWRVTRAWLARHYGYDTYGGNCHLIPNHGLIILGLLYGDDDLRRSLMIVNTSGWDTDCNSGNVGCLLGVKNGLAGLATVPDLRLPLADRLYLPTADGGRAITDALQEAEAIVEAGRALRHLPPARPKGGARYHFSLPGAVQGFRAHTPTVTVAHARVAEVGRLALTYQLAPKQTALAGTDTFVPPEARALPGYELVASPTLYPGQTVRARVLAGPEAPAAVEAGIYLRYYGPEEALHLVRGPGEWVAPGREATLTWRVPPLDGAPIAEVGLWLETAASAAGTVYLDALSWDGEPEIAWVRPAVGGEMWRRAWVDAVDHYFTHFAEMFRMAQDAGRGLLMHGTREWRDIAAAATFTPHLAGRFGVAVRVQGLRRYYALLADAAGQVRLVRVLGEETVLAEAARPPATTSAVRLRLEAVGPELRGWVDDVCVFTLQDPESPLASGGLAFVVEDGTVCVDAAEVRPARGVKTTS